MRILISVVRLPLNRLVHNRTARAVAVAQPLASTSKSSGYLSPVIVALNLFIAVLPLNASCVGVRIRQGIKILSNLSWSDR